MIEQENETTNKKGWFNSRKNKQTNKRFFGNQIEYKDFIQIIFIYVFLYGLLWSYVSVVR